MWARFAESALKWVREKLPGLVAIGTLVYMRMKRIAVHEQDLREKAELEKKYMENADAVEAKNRDRPDADLVADAIAEGERLRKPKP